MTSESAPPQEEFEDINDFVAAHDAFFDAQPPTKLAVLDRAVRLGSNSLWGIKVQLRRIRGSEPEDVEWLMRAWTDIQFLVVALWQMRQSGVLALSAGAEAERLQGSLASFDAQLPDLKRMRDVAQHLDEYSVDGPGRRHVRPGRTDKVGRRMLEVGRWTPSEFHWLDGSIDFEIADQASQELYAAVREIRDQIQTQLEKEL